MEYRLLGRSGLKVSALSMGTMTLGSNKSGPIGSVGLKEGKRLIDHVRRRRREPDRHGERLYRAALRRRSSARR